MTPRKVRAVAELMRGLRIDEAEAQLLHEPRRAAKPLLKLLRSAVANAKVKKLDPERLVIESVRVDQGPMLKRFLPRARGVATPIQKKMSHVILTVQESHEAQSKFKIVIKKKIKLPGEEKKRAKKQGGGRGKAEEVKETKKPGFLRRFFRRKAI